MGLITVSRLESAMGTCFTDKEATQAQLLIDKVSAYIETYTGSTFSLIEDDVVRCQADYYGEIDLGPDPIADVTSVFDYRCQREDSCWMWDGLDTIYNLESGQVVDVTFSHGYETPPDDICGVIESATKRGMENEPGLKSKTVGDVTEVYHQGDSVAAALSLDDFEKAVVNSYKQTEQTWRIGPSYRHTRRFPGQM